MQAPFNFEQVWPGLKNSIELVIKICQNIVRDQKLTHESWMALYNQVYQWCIKGTTEKKAELYQNVIKIFKEYAAIEKKHLQDKRGDELLRDYMRRFSDFTSATLKLRKMFGYMHTYWVPERIKANDQSVRDMYEMSLLNWRESVFEPLQQQVIGALLALITTDRDGKGGEKILLKNVLDSIVSIGVKETQPVLYYKQVFQDPFIVKTKEYYTAESTEYIAKNPIAQYMVQAEQRIVQEEALATSYLHPTTKPELIKVMEITLIDQHNKPMQEAFQVFLKDKDSADDMRRFYFLLSRIEKGLDRSAETFKSFLQVQGQNILKEHGGGLMGQNAQKNAMELTKALVALHVKYTDINKSCFSDHVLFRDALDKAFTVIMNPDKAFLDTHLAGGRVGLPEVLNMYADHLLRGNEKEIREEELDKRFDSIVKMFSYLDDKDLFYKLFKAKLARRLLGKFRDEQEQSFLGKLKQQEGAGQELRSLEGMFNDVRQGSSSEKQSEWEEYARGGDESGIKMKTTVLPLFEQNWSAVIRPVTLNMPSDFQAVQKKYNEFTNRNAQKDPNAIKKVISWIYQEGTCEIVTTTVNEKKKKQKITLVVSPVQAAVLYLFNTKSQIKFEELRNELNMNEDALKFCLHPLIYHKNRVLANAGPTGKGKEKPPEGKKLKIQELYESDDIIVALPRMTTEGKPKIQYPPGPGIMDTDTTNRINEQVKRERAILIDLAVVRIMKARNKAPIKNVVGEVIQQLVKFFQPQQKDIMRRIQSLIERSFVRRDDEDHTQLIYVA